MSCTNFYCALPCAHRLGKFCGHFIASQKLAERWSGMALQLGVDNSTKQWTTRIVARGILKIVRRDECDWFEEEK